MERWVNLNKPDSKYVYVFASENDPNYNPEKHYVADSNGNFDFLHIAHTEQGDSRYDAEYFLGKQSGSFNAFYQGGDKDGLPVEPESGEDNDGGAFRFYQYNQSLVFTPEGATIGEYTPDEMNSFNWQPDRRLNIGEVVMVRFKLAPGINGARLYYFKKALGDVDGGGATDPRLVTREEFNDLEARVTALENS